MFILQKTRDSSLNEEIRKADPKAKICMLIFWLLLGMVTDWSDQQDSLFYILYGFESS